MDKPKAPRRPLEGLLVIDAGVLFAAPLCGTLLGDFGADVIKIEHPDGGDALRGLGHHKNGEALWWKIVGRNKRSVTLNLSKEKGQELFLELASQADVVIESFRPGTLERWNLDWDRLRAANHRLVLLRTSGFGQNGPYAHRPGFGTLAEAMSGFAAITGHPDAPPTLPPFGLADGVAALTGTAMVMIALYHREAGDGKGQAIDLSLIEPLFWILGPQATTYDQLGIVQERCGNRVPFVAPRNLYRTSDDEWVAISASSEPIAKRILSIVGGEGLVADPRFATNEDRLNWADELDDLISAWMAKHTRDEIIAEFERAEAAVAPVYSIIDILQDPHYQAREAVVEVQDGALGSILMQGLIAKLTETPGAIRSTGPALGEHTDEVLSDILGLSAGEINELRREGVV